MYITATVKKINEDSTVLVGCSNEVCQGCKAEMFCNNKDDTDFLSVNRKKVALSVGDKVELFLPPARTILSTVMLFALPLILFPIGYILVKKCTSANEIICALGGFAAMAVSFSIAAVINLKHKKDLMPIITCVID